MNTTAAAAEAQVTTATVRVWCRRGVVAAVKTAGRWIIDAASLTARIRIGQRKARMTDQPTFLLTSKTTRVRGHLGAGGPSNTLRAAYEAGQPITLGGSYAGERVYLGHTRQTYGDHGVTLETVGLDRELTVRGEAHAIYLIDLTRLDNAPKLAALVRAEDARRSAIAHAAEQRAAEEDARLDRLDREEY